MKFLLAFAKLTLGLLLGLALLEVTLRADPALLLHGMGVPAPVDAPVTVSRYTVHLSDADLFLWSPELMRPIPAEQDQVEAEVRFETDEFGFPNAAPLPAQAEVVLLGRSYSLGAQAAQPWPRLFVEQTGWRVVNLSQTGAGIDLKRDYLRRFGWLRRPRWIILEVLPSMDVAGPAATDPLLIQQLPFPVLQSLARRLRPPAAAQPQPDGLYPLAMDIPGRTASLTFFYYYLSYLTIDREMLAGSATWADYAEAVRALVREAREHSACVALLYAPTKENIYLPLAAHPVQLNVLRTSTTAYRLAVSGELILDSSLPVNVGRLPANASAARQVLADFARAEGLPLVDPTDALQRAALAGAEPFMHYDTHWSALGHQIVARAVADALRNAPCP